MRAPSPVRLRTAPNYGEKSGSLKCSAQQGVPYRKPLSDSAFTRLVNRRISNSQTDPARRIGVSVINAYRIRGSVHTFTQSSIPHQQALSTARNGIIFSSPPVNMQECLGRDPVSLGTMTKIMPGSPPPTESSSQLAPTTSSPNTSPIPS